MKRSVLDVRNTATEYFDAEVFRGCLSALFDLRTSVVRSSVLYRGWHSVPAIGQSLIDVSLCRRQAPH